MNDLVVISHANIFEIYPEIFETILEDERNSGELTFPTNFVPLPTDNDYQERVYYRLLNLQKNINRRIVIK